MTDGTCARCPKNSKPSGNQRSCMKTIPDCGDRERLSSDKASCIACNDFTRAQFSHTVCAADECYTNQIVS